MEHPYRADINYVIEYDDLSLSQDLPDTFGNDVNRYIFLYKYTSYLDAIIYFINVVKLFFFFITDTSELNFNCFHFLIFERIPE
jgi:hypothetical protein